VDSYLKMFGQKLRITSPTQVNKLSTKFVNFLNTLLTWFHSELQPISQWTQHRSITELHKKAECKFIPVPN